MKSMELKTKFSEQFYDVADKTLKKPMPVLTEELFSEFEKNGNRVNYEKVYFERRKILTSTFMAAVFNGAAAYKEKLSDIILDICMEETWALPAHVNRAKDPAWRTNVDLFASETAAALAVAIYKCSNDLPKDTINIAIHEIKRRVIVPIFVEKRKYGWQTSKDNWNAVCNGSIGIAIIVLNKLLFDDVKEILASLDTINKSLTYYIDGFSSDGGCLEGMGYYNYGLSYFTSYAERLYNFSNGRINLFQNPKLRKIAEFPQRIFFTNGKCVNFSDANANEKIHFSIIHKLAKFCGTKETLPPTWLADFNYDSCYRLNVIYEDYLAIGKLTQSDYVPMNVRILPEAQWVVAESENGISFAIKGGNNDEPHNHNDIGNFIYSAGATEIACDLGQGEYTKDYFSDKRYEVLYTSSLGHNVPMVDGQAQIPGKHAKAENFKAKMENGEVVVSMDISKAYETKGNVLRTAVFNLENGKLTITDEFNGCYGQERIVSRNRIGDNIQVAYGLKKEENSKRVNNHEGNEELVYIYSVSGKSEKNEIYNTGNSSERSYSTIIYSLCP